MNILILTLVGLLLASVIMLMSIIVSEKIITIKRRKRQEQLNELMQGDEIEIRYPGYDSRAIFKGLINDMMHVIAYKNGVANEWKVITTNWFVKKI